MKMKGEQREPQRLFLRRLLFSCQGASYRNRLFACLVWATAVPADPALSGHLYLWPSPGPFSFLCFVHLHLQLAHNLTPPVAGFWCSLPLNGSTCLQSSVSSIFCYPLGSIYISSSLACRLWNPLGNPGCTFFVLSKALLHASLTDFPLQWGCVKGLVPSLIPCMPQEQIPYWLW